MIGEGSLWCGILHRCLCLAAFLTGVLCGAADGYSQTVPSSLYARSYAVVVGVGRYTSETWPDLAYARKDAEAMGDFLRRQGFEVFSLMDEQATAKAIISVFEDRLAPRLRKDDRVLFFFSGHGDTQTLGGKDFGYLVPYDGTSKRGSLISMETLRSLSDKMGGAKHQAFIIDACFGGLFAPTKARFVGIDKRHPRYIREITRRNGRQFLTAGGKGQQVLAGGPKGYSYFTGYLLEALQDGLGDLNGDGYVTLSEAATYLVPRATNAYQTPGMGTLPGHGLGDFVFVAPGGPQVAAAKSVGPDGGLRLGLKGTAGNRQQETLFWQSIKDSRNAEDFRAYLETFPRGTFAALARNRVRQIARSPESSSVSEMAKDNKTGREPDTVKSQAGREQRGLRKEPKQTGVKQPSAIATATEGLASSDPSDVVRYIKENPADARAELGHFLRRHFNIADGGFEVYQIWQYRVVRSLATGHVVRLHYEVKEGFGNNELRDGEFVARLVNGSLKFVDVIANGG